MVCLGCAERIPGVQIGLSFSGQTPDAASMFARSINLDEAQIALSDVQLLACPEDGTLSILRQWLLPISIAWAHHAAVYAEGRRNMNRLTLTDPLNLLDEQRRELGTTAALGGRWCGLVVEIDGRTISEFTRLRGHLEPRARMGVTPFEWNLDDTVSLELPAPEFTTSKSEVVQVHLNGDLESALEVLEGIVEPTEEELSMALSRVLRITVP